MFYSIRNYFSLSGVILMIVGQFFPIWTKMDIETGFTYKLFAWHLIEYNNTNEIINDVQFPYLGIGMFLLFVILIMLYSSTIKFNDLIAQQQITKIGIISSITLLIFCYILIENFNKEWNNEFVGQYSWGFYMFILSISFYIMSYSSITKDINLIRSSRRIR